MRKSSIIAVVLIFVLFSTIVVAQQSSSITPNTIYFGQQKQFDLQLNNVLQIPKNRISINLAPLTATGATDFYSWTETVAANAITWDNGVLPDNTIGIFRFTARAPTGSSQQTVDLEVDMRDINNVNTQEIVQITMLVDNIAPTLTNPNPMDGSFI